MKHYTKGERRIRRSGYDEGYKAGYKQGLHDGNPFNAIGEAAARVADACKKLYADPAFQEACHKYSEKKNSHKGNCDFCKHHNIASTEYPCCVCGDGENYFEMWEEAEE